MTKDLSNTVAYAVLSLKKYIKCIHDTRVKNICMSADNKILWKKVLETMTELYLNALGLNYVIIYEWRGILAHDTFIDPIHTT